MPLPPDRGDDPWVPGAPLPQARPGSGFDRMYGRRARVFVDPVGAWNPSLRDICRQGEIASLAANAVNETVVEYTVPKGRIAYLDGLGQEASCQAFQELTWRLFVGSGLWLEISPIAQVGSFLLPFPLHCFVEGGVKVTLAVSSGANAFLNVAGMLRGVERNIDNEIPQEVA